MKTTLTVITSILFAQSLLAKQALADAPIVPIPNAIKADDRGEVTLFVQKNSQIQIEGRIINDSELKAKLESISVTFPNQPVRIKGEPGTRFQDIIRVIALCQKASIWNISFSTDKQ